MSHLHLRPSLPPWDMVAFLSHAKLGRGIAFFLASVGFYRVWLSTQSFNLTHSLSLSTRTPETQTSGPPEARVCAIRRLEAVGALGWRVFHLGRWSPSVTWPGLSWAVERDEVDCHCVGGCPFTL